MRFLRRRDVRSRPAPTVRSGPVSPAAASAGPQSFGDIPGIIVWRDAHYWHERYGPDAQWADFSSQDPEYEWAVAVVAHLQGMRFRRFQISTRVGNVPPPKVHCAVIANDPVGELPTYVSQRWPSLDAALEQAGWHSRREGDLLVQVVVDSEERVA